MILYSSSAIDFRRSVDNNTITRQIENAYTSALGRRPAPSERNAWNYSMRFMETLIRNSQVADDCGVLIEFTIPASSKRVDFIISGKNQTNENNYVVVELKQWEKAEATEKDGIVRSVVGGGLRDLTHPSYQAWSYRQMIDDMNTAVQDYSLLSHSCAYLHNYYEQNPEPLRMPQYSNYLEEAPIFFQSDTEKLQSFLYKHVGKGKGMDILYQIENGQIKPSKKLMDYVAKVFQGAKEFVLIDEQKVAYEAIIEAVMASKNKRTIIVRGGPGTGKSVISINAFGALIAEQMNVRFVAPNSAFRKVMLEKLTANAHGQKGRIRNLFSGSSAFFDADPNTFDALIVDEAHRLKGHGAYQYRGENQIEDIIKASRVNVFFIDDAQRVRPDDIGSEAKIKQTAELYDSDIYEIELEAQFRCSGAQGFINWLDTALQLRDTGNYDGWDKEAFDFQLVDNPNTLRDMIHQKIEEGYNARLLAGFAWKWTSEKKGNRNAEISDVSIPEHNFAMPWNSRADRELWAINPDGEHQIGCIHTSQGLEFDYVGVIIGQDLQFDTDALEVRASYAEYKDSAGKKKLKDDPSELTRLVSNVYRTLMSRGMKGCYVYCRNEELYYHLKRRYAATLS